MSKKVQLKYKKERMLLSDILPYEAPITFSNRYLYEFLIRLDLHYTDGNFFWKHINEITDVAVLILLGLNKDTEIIDHFHDDLTYKKLKEKIDGGRMATIPFNFVISHLENQHRELAVIHPRNQIVAVEFYHKYKELILYYCSKSFFSLRAPDSIAKCIYWDHKSRLQKFEQDDITIEEKGKDYKNLRSFFVYKKYSNVFKFYESKDFHRCEKQYNSMAKLDVSKCFSSIYTHTIAWAIINKDIIKDVLSKGGSKKYLDQTFAGKFDALMQTINYNETNGIVIGPEISRVFAELIFQQIDVNLKSALDDKLIIFKKDYEIFRYVDDYFIFYNDASIYEKISSLLQFSLREFKLHLNMQKKVIYEKPIITEITIAKNQIAGLLTDIIKYNISEETIEDSGFPLKIVKGTVYINSDTFITKFKTIIKHCNVQYKDILNYTLSVVERKSKKLIRDYFILKKDIILEKRASHNKAFISATLSLIDFSFFIYSVAPRVNFTIKLFRVLDQFIRMLQVPSFEHDSKHVVYKSIFDNICHILKKNKSEEFLQIETLYLLIILSEIGKQYWLDQVTLAEFCGARENSNGNFYFNHSLSHFSITVLLFYMREKRRYNKIKSAVVENAKKKFIYNKSVLHKNAELTMLFLDLISCPFISVEEKRIFFSYYDIKNISMQGSFIALSDTWFTKWTDFDFAKELDSKRSLDVY